MAIHLVTSEWQVHIINGFFQNLPTGGIIDGWNLVSLDDRLSRQAFAGSPCGNHIHFVLQNEFIYRGLRFRYFVSGIHRDHFNFVSINAAFHLVDVTEIIALSLFVKLPPG